MSRRTHICPDCGKEICDDCGGIVNHTPPSGWTPRTAGWIGDHEVTFRQGTGRNEGHTLIADGNPSGRSFDRRGEHNHYGPRREGGGYVEEDRGYYTGPDH